MSNEITNIQTWLESLNHPVADTAFPPRTPTGAPQNISVPFIIYLDRQTVEGSDDKNLVIFHALQIEYYTETRNVSDLRDLLVSSGLHFTEETSWIKEEQLFMTLFDITDDLVEKIEEA